MGARQTKGALGTLLQTSLIYKSREELLNMNRIFIRVVVGWITGHTVLNHHI